MCGATDRVAVARNDEREVQRVITWLVSVKIVRSKAEAIPYTNAHTHTPEPRVLLAWMSELTEHSARTGNR